MVSKEGSEEPRARSLPLIDLREQNLSDFLPQVFLAARQSWPFSRVTSIESSDMFEKVLICGCGKVVDPIRF